MVVLLVLTLLTVVGFALGDLCVVHLNLSHRFLSTSRARLLAQAAVQQFLLTFERASMRQRESGLNLDRQESADLGLTQLYATGDGLPNAPFVEAGSHVGVTFDATADWHSTDNALSEYPRAGWLDRGTARKTVPPFSVELLVNVTMDGSVHHYRAIITRRWPFAVFTPRGSIVLCGSPTSSGEVGEPAIVEGPVATLGGSFFGGWKSAVAKLPSVTTLYGQSVDEDGQRVPTPLTDGPQNLAERIVEMNRLEPRCEVYVERAVCIGPPMRFEPAGSLLPGLGEPPATTISPAGPDAPAVEIREVVLDDEDAPKTPLSTQKPMSEATESQNALVGDVSVPPSWFEMTAGTISGIEQIEQVKVYPGNTHNGKILAGAPAGVDQKHNPADDASFPSTKDFELLGAPPLPQAVADAMGINPGVGADEAMFSFLCGTLSIDPEQADAGPLQVGGGHSKWYVPGSMGNRCVASSPKKGPVNGATGADATPDIKRYKIIETSGSLRLRNAVLYVAGNLDLAGDVTGRHTVGIEGSNSTLIVNGTLALSGGRLDSRDQGLVILANDIVMRAHGDYRGLIIAKNSLTILSDGATTGDSSKTLTIRGGVICGNKKKGNVILRSVRIIYDPVYMKALHAFGEPVCDRWREVSAP